MSYTKPQVFSIYASVIYTQSIYIQPSAHYNRAPAHPRAIIYMQAVVIFNPSIYISSPLAHNITI